MSQDKRNQALQYRVNMIGSTYTLYREIFNTFFTPFSSLFSAGEFRQGKFKCLSNIFFNTNVSWIQDRAIQFEGTGIFFHVLCISILLLYMIMEDLGIQTVRE